MLKVCQSALLQAGVSVVVGDLLARFQPLASKQHKKQGLRAPYHEVTHTLCRWQQRRQRDSCSSSGAYIGTQQISRYRVSSMTVAGI